MVSLDPSCNNLDRKLKLRVKFYKLYYYSYGYMTIYSTGAHTKQSTRPMDVQPFNSLECPEPHLLFWYRLLSIHSFLWKQLFDHNPCAARSAYKYLHDAHYSSTCKRYIQVFKTSPLQGVWDISAFWQCEPELCGGMMNSVKSKLDRCQEQVHLAPQESIDLVARVSEHDAASNVALTDIKSYIAAGKENGCLEANWHGGGVREDWVKDAIQ